MSHGDNSLNKHDEQGRKGKEKLCWWWVETWVMKGVGQGQNEKFVLELEKWSQGFPDQIQCLHRELAFPQKKHLLQISAKRRVIQHVVPDEAVFPIFCQRMRWIGDQWERYGHSWSLLGVQLEETDWGFSSSLMDFLGIVLLCYYRIFPCFQAAVYHFKEKAKLKVEPLLKSLICSRPAYRKLVKSLLTKWRCIMAKRTWKVAYFSVVMDLNSLLHISATKCKRIIHWKSSQKHNYRSQVSSMQALTCTISV